MRKLLMAALILCLLLAGVPALAETPAMAVPQGARIIALAGPFASTEGAVALSSASGDGMVNMENIGELIIADSLSSALMLLQSGRGDVYVTAGSAARYLASQNEAYAAITGFLPVTLHLLAGPGQEEFAAAVNEAFATLREAGVMDALWQIHVEDVIAGGEIQAVALPAFDGAPTYRIGLSGDLPPMDYTTPNGDPAGYNTAVLAEIAEILQVNFVPVITESGSRFAALESGVIDVFFWQMEADMNAVSADAGAALEALQESSLGRFTLSDAYAQVLPGWLMLARK